MTTLISSKHFRYPEFLQHIPFLFDKKGRLFPNTPTA